MQCFNADILPFENPHVVPVVEISIGNSRMKAHIDSGTWLAVSFSRLHWLIS